MAAANSKHFLSLNCMPSTTLSGLLHPVPATALEDIIKYFQKNAVTPNFCCNLPIPPHAQKPLKIPKFGIGYFAFKSYRSQ